MVVETVLSPFASSKFPNAVATLASSPTCDSALAAADASKEKRQQVDANNNDLNNFMRCPFVGVSLI